MTQEAIVNKVKVMLVREKENYSRATKDSNKNAQLFYDGGICVLKELLNDIDNTED